MTKQTRKTKEAVPVAKRSGPKTLFPNKVRTPKSLGFASEQIEQLARAKQRTGFSESDICGVLVKRFADTVEEYLS